MLFKSIILTVIIVLLAVIATWIAINNDYPATTSDGNTQSAVKILNKNNKEIKLNKTDGSSALLVANNMSPGDSRSNSITFFNQSKLPVKITMNPYQIESSNSGANKFKAKLVAGNKVIYNDFVDQFSEATIGNLSPGKQVKVTMYGILPANAGNQAQDSSTTFNLRWTTTVNKNVLPPECKYQNIRTRLFIFKNRNAIRMTTRYQARSGGRVRVDFYWRVWRNNQWVRGQRVAVMSSWFKRTGKGQFRQQRVLRNKSPETINRLRSAKHGFIATLKPRKTPGYCRRYLNVDLVELKRKFGDGQFTWFQRGSFRYHKR
jgi:hypothetical protein